MCRIQDTVPGVGGQGFKFFTSATSTGGQRVATGHKRDKVEMLVAVT